jgi:hypothetical protein
MDSTQNVPQIGPDAPHPYPEVADIQAKLEASTQPAKAEAASVVAEQPGSIQAASTAATNAAASGIPSTLAPVDPTPASTTPHHDDSPADADDGDLIEQEWVNKAKAIVERTREDPYLQNKEMNKFKADYIMKRYKREIKVDEA